MAKKKLKIPSVKRLMAAVTADEMTGYCVRCGEEIYSIEPDCRGMRCEACGEKGVYGAQELLFMVVA